MAPSNIAPLLSSRDLIPFLDPERSYGELTYEAVVEGVQAGWITLTPSDRRDGQPFIMNSLSGLMMKGTASHYRPSRSAGLKQIDANRERFQERAGDDFSRVYNALVESAASGVHQSIKIFMEYFLGAPVKPMDGGASKEVVDIMQALAQKTAQRIEYIDAETGETRE